MTRGALFLVLAGAACAGPVVEEPPLEFTDAYGPLPETGPGAKPFNSNASHPRITRNPYKEKLMEAQVGASELNALGPRHDEIRMAHAAYGDLHEPNDSLEAATELGRLELGRPILVGRLPPNTLGDVQIPDSTPTSTLSVIATDGGSDADHFRFELAEAARVLVQIHPVGLTYAEDHTSPGNAGACLPGPYRMTDSLTQANLAFRVRDGAGAVVHEADRLPDGAGEGALLSLGPGPHSIEVHADPESFSDVPERAVQLCQLNLLHLGGRGR
jgi:hypothetical protein